MTIARRLTVIALYLTMIAFAVVALAAARPGLSAEPQAITRYTMTVEVDNKSFLSVVQTVTYQAETEITSLVFNVPPAAAEFNAFTLSSASIAETSVTPAQDGVLLELPLPKPVQAGEMVSATLRWWGQLPPSNGRYGTADGVQVLGNWYPMLATMRNGVWERHQYTQIGDAYFSAVADYDVTVSAPQNVTIAASGSLVARNQGTWILQARKARDFAMVISSRFQTMTRKVDQVTITMYYLPDSAEGARKCLDVTEEAMRWYAKRIGPYPFPALAVVQVPNGSQQHSAQEHTGLFLIRSDILTPSTVGIYAAHELAHSWFFASVGNDQINQPWLDEGLATSVSLDFYRENYPQEYQAQWGVWGGSVEDFKNTIELNRGIFDFDNGSVYFWSIYRQGAAFFRVVREAMGDDAYWKALRAYTNDFAFKIAEPNDLLRALRAAAPDKDLVSIFRQFLDYPYLKYTNLNVTVGGSDASLWSGQVAVPISVTADSPTYTLSVILDGSVITTTNQPVTVTVDAGSLPDGSHTLAAIADDGGINRAEARRLFRVQQATATPMVTPVPTATRTPAPVAPRAAPSVTPQATITSAPTSPQTSPTPSPQPPPAAAGKTSLPALPVVSAVVVLVIGAGFLLARHKRWI